MKGILNIKGSSNRFVFQGVHMLFDGREDRPWGDSARANDLVFIGKNLDRAELTRGLERCRAWTASAALKKAELPHRWTFDAGDYVAVARISRDGRLCVIGAGNGDVNRRRPSKPAARYSVRGAHAGSVLGLALSPEGTRFATCGQGCERKDLALGRVSWSASCLAAARLGWSTSRGRQRVGAWLYCGRPKGSVVE